MNRRWSRAFLKKIAPVLVYSMFLQPFQLLFCNNFPTPECSSAFNKQELPDINLEKTITLIPTIISCSELITPDDTVPELQELLSKIANKTPTIAYTTAHHALIQSYKLLQRHHTKIADNTVKQLISLLKKSWDEINASSRALRTTWRSNPDNIRLDFNAGVIGIDATNHLFGINTQTPQTDCDIEGALLVTHTTSLLGNVGIGGAAASDSDTLLVTGNAHATGTIVADGTITAGTGLTVSTGGVIITGTVDLLAQSELHLHDAAGGEYVGLSAPATVPASYTLSLPNTAPTTGQFLQAGPITANDLTWITVASVSTSTTTRTVYVSKAGNDTTGNGALATPYLTLAKAIDTANGISSASNPVTISVQSGTYIEDNSAGPLTITASGVSIAGASIEGVIIQPSTLSQDLLQCTVNTLEFNNFTIDAGADGSTASGIVFASNAPGTTRFNSVAAYRFFTAFACNGSDGTPILIFNNVQPRGNTTGIAFSSCRGLIKNCTFLGPFSGSTVSNTGITITGQTSLITILSNSFRLMQTAISAAGQSNMRILGSNIESSTNGIVCAAASHNDIVGCNFVVNNSSSINVTGTDAGTQVHVAGCHFDCADGDGSAQGTALKVTSDASIFVDACGINDCVSAIQCGEVGDTASTVFTANATTISRCTADITQNGSTTLNFSAGTASDSKISINDSTNVQLALFDLEDGNQLHIGKFTDVNTDLLQAFISPTDNPQIDYLSSLYSTQAIGYNNPNSNPTNWFTKSNQNTNLTSITTDRTKAAGVRLVSDTGTPVGGTTALRGWDLAKIATTSELTFNYQNTDITGQSLINSYTVMQLDGVNNQLQLPTAGTQIVFASDTNLYRSAANTLKTDDNFIAAGSITATSGFSGNLTGNVTGHATLDVLKAGDTMTGALTLPAGSATSPQLQFTGSTSTGLSAGTANTLSLDAAGTEIMNISSSGVAIPSMTAAGVVHNAVTTGLLSSSLIVNADITDTTITNTKLATISSVNTAGNIVVRDNSGNFATNMITIAGTTTNSTDVATKAYVDSTVSSGLVAKDPALVASTTDVTLSGTQTIDGVSLVANDRVLLVGQTDPIQNGLWLAQSGAWTRPADFANGDAAGEAYVLVTSGNTYAGASWLCSTPAAIIETDPIQFQQFSIPGQTTGANVGAGTGQIFKNKTGNTINFRTIVAGTHLAATTNTDDVTLATDATNANTASTIVARDGSGNFSAGTITASLTGHASLDLPLTGGTLSGALTIPAGSAGTPALNFTGSTTTGLSAATADTLSLDTAGVERMKLNSSGVTIPAMTTAGVVHNAATTGLLSSSLIVNADITDTTITNAKLATIASANTAGAIVVRDGSGNFSAGTITANLAGNVTGSASLNVLKAGDTMTGALLMPVGSAATPALQVGATNVGLSSQSSGLSLSTSGTARMTVSSSGTIAITDVAGGFTTAGVVHNDSSGNLSSSLIVNADVAAGAAIADTKLATISTAGKVSNSATTATSANTASTIVARDTSGNFAAGTITMAAGSVVNNLQFNTGTTALNAVGSASTSGVRVAYARVTSAGVVTGSGISLTSHTAGTGVYVLAFSPAFVAAPVVYVTPTEVASTAGATDTCTFVTTNGVAPTASAATVGTYTATFANTSSLAAADHAFNILAIGV